ncbi:MAG: cytochrome-c peroxidase, partial [Bacteroidia bacterium]|nr:cytochrome-c peroxidase [Bacteroidia bacterium]
MSKILVSIALCGMLFFYACKKKDSENSGQLTAVQKRFGNTIDLNNLHNYSSQTRPAYITSDNSGFNPISDKGATLGRVLFYDKKLSSNNEVACASCHLQAFAFGDTAKVSKGVNGNTGRHSMRLVNNRFSQEVRYFWDERASSLETQSTMPIQDHNEMGYSGLNGDQNLQDLINKLKAIDYYQELFQFVYGSSEITESRIQLALSQFIRSIQSFDSKYDIGRQLAGSDGPPFINYTQAENQGKNLFLSPPVFDANGNRTSGGLGCQGCHRAPDFNIDPNTINNGIINSLSGGFDLLN